RGAVYVFNASGSTWSQTQKLVAGDGSAGDLFGTAVAIDSGYALIGAPAASTTAAVNVGEDHVYQQSGGSLSHVGTLTAESTAPGDEFGHAIVMQGSRALIGTSASRGAIYLFSLAAGQWQQDNMILAGSGGGQALALEGNLVIAGQPNNAGGKV